MVKTKQVLQSELQSETLNVIGKRYSIGIEIGTGGGKTLLGLKHMAKLYTDTASFCVAAPTKKIFDSWRCSSRKCD
jgi:superfamily II DNA or RNA helicase